MIRIDGKKRTYFKKHEMISSFMIVLRRFKTAKSIEIRGNEKKFYRTAVTNQEQ